MPPPKEYEPKKAKAVRNSTTGYRREIFFPQFRHLPFKTKKLRTGMLSYHFIGF